jgi:hypothetical protein
MIEWINCNDELPPFNRRVLAWMEGRQCHSGVDWVREGYAFMVRHDGTEHVVGDGWASGFYDAALTTLSADNARVTHWAYLTAPAKEQP